MPQAHVARSIRADCVLEDRVTRDGHRTAGAGRAVERAVKRDGGSRQGHILSSHHSTSVLLRAIRADRWRVQLHRPRSRQTEIAGQGDAGAAVDRADRQPVLVIEVQAARRSRQGVHVVVGVRQHVGRAKPAELETIGDDGLALGHGATGINDDVPRRGDTRRIDRADVKACVGLDPQIAGVGRQGSDRVVTGRQIVAGASTFEGQTCSVQHAGDRLADGVAGGGREDGSTGGLDGLQGGVARQRDSDVARIGSAAVAIQRLYRQRTDAAAIFQGDVTSRIIAGFENTSARDLDRTHRVDVT